jgi:hypothetical protein
MLLKKQVNVIIYNMYVAQYPHVCVNILIFGSIYYFKLFLTCQSMIYEGETLIKISKSMIHFMTRNLVIKDIYD